MSVFEPETIALAIDIGGTKVDAALVDSHGVVRAASRSRRPTGPASTPASLLTAVDEVIAASIAHLAQGERLAGVGIGSAGPISLGAGTIAPLNMPALAGTPVRDHIERMSGARAVLRLDGTCIALAEYWLGAAAGVSNCMAMVVSTGVGGGIILNNRLIAGETGNAGHIGQLQIGTRTPGQSSSESSLEHLASGPRTVEWARSEGWPGSSGEELAVSYRAGDPIARAAVRRSANAVGEAIASVSTLLDLHTVAIGGGFVAVAEDYFDIVNRTIQEAASVDYARAVRAVPSGLAGDGPLIGAAALIFRSDLL